MPGSAFARNWQPSLAAAYKTAGDWICSPSLVRTLLDSTWETFPEHPFPWNQSDNAPLTRPEAIRAMMETILHILSKDTGGKPAKKAKGK
jgi:hypothetical protein